MDSDRSPALAFVEDSDSDFALFARAFHDCGEISRWRSGEDALAAFMAGEVDLHELGGLVVDLNLPGMDGCDVIALMRAMPGGGAPAVCMLTTSERPEDEERAMAAGADGYLVKPSDLAGLKTLPQRVAAIAAGRPGPE